ncbi:MAG: hypothetical protein JOZ22_05240 [Acidobacteriia bacterium]|nr:hypothetical protein [Terriglobia bacterium]
MRAIKGILTITMALAAIASAQTKYFGGVDVGSKGTKAALFSATRKADGDEIKLIFGKTVNGPLVSSMRDGRLFTTEGIKWATDTTRDLLGAMQDEANKRKLTGVQYYIVGSSGVAHGENREELAEAMKSATQIEMDFIDAAREGYYGLTSSVPIRRRAQSLYIDIGSGNTKLGCLVGGSDLKSFRPAEIKYGSVSGRNKGAQINPTDIPSGIQQLMHDEVGPAYTRQSLDIPCLANRQRIYWTGGAAWATATLMHPERALDSYVLINTKDIDAFLSKLQDRTWNQRKLAYFFAKDTEAEAQNRIRARAEKERDDVMNTFVREDLLSGVSIMKTVLEISNPSAVLIFARESGFIYGFGLEKNEKNELRQDAGISAERVAAR